MGTLWIGLQQHDTANIVLSNSSFYDPTFIYLSLFIPLFSSLFMPLFLGVSLLHMPDNLFLPVTFSLSLFPSNTSLLLSLSLYPGGWVSVCVFLSLWLCVCVCVPPPTLTYTLRMFFIFIEHPLAEWLNDFFLAHRILCFLL